MSSESLLNFVVCIVAFIAFFIFFQKTKFGLAMRGTAEDHALAQSEGIRVSWIFVVSWVVAILLAAVGGVFMSAVWRKPRTIAQSGHEIPSRGHSGWFGVH